ncbi:hypothetical protein [Gorillibacterium sp. sgz5001074]|uniref:hypothetical protein n=1 Tax=Gorillibacterium sp. sgz5001074 TaxID=3446695 RepID=UPI003F6669DA
MKKAKKAVLVMAALLLLLSPFAPWITENAAEARALGAFKAQWKHTSDGCGFNCVDCGAKRTRRVWFGRKIEIEYACGMLPSDSPEYHKRKELFVSFLGTVHGK